MTFIEIKDMHVKPATMEFKSEAPAVGKPDLTPEEILNRETPAD